MSSSSYLFPKVHKSKKIIEKINESSNICTNMQVPKDMKVKRIIDGSNSSTEGISGLLEKLLSPIVSNFKKIYQGWFDFIRKLPTHVGYPSVLASCDVLSLYTSTPHDFGLEALFYWSDKKLTLIPERFTKVLILEAASFGLWNNNFPFDNCVSAISW